MNLKTLLSAIFAMLFLGQSALAQKVPLYKDPKAPLEARVNDLFARLTPHEELSLLSGTAFTTQPIPRLGVPAMAMADAGQGVRGGMGSTLGPATLFPAGVTMASTWDPALVGQIGKAIGEEALNKGTGVQVMLGPAIDIQRSPLGGRNGEYFSEDPYLTGQLAVGYIKGMQSTGCGACVKHYACNNEEVDRGFVNVKVDERALREIYLSGFEAAVKDGHVWTLMSSYNRVNGHHMSANPYLLTSVLRGDWGFDGIVMSDWGGVHETVGAVNSGNDLEMPGPGYLAPAKLEKALAQHRIAQATIDRNAKNILRTIIRVGLLNGPRKIDHSVVNSPAHQKLAYRAATQGIVLLKNTGHILPLSLAKIHSIAVIGPGAKGMQYGAAGSPSVQPFYAISPLDGITKRVGGKAQVNYAPGTNIGDPIPQSAFRCSGGAGLDAEYYNNRTLAGVPTVIRTDPNVQFDWSDSPAPGVAHTDFSVRWTGQLIAPKTGRYTLTLTADDGSRLWLGGQLLIDHWFEGGASPQSIDVDLVAGRSYDLQIAYFQAGGLASAQLNWTIPGSAKFADAVAAARKSDVAIVCVTTSGTESEGTDRPSMDLPGGQDSLIEAVAAANPRTIVVLNNGTPIAMTDWLDNVPGLVEAWFPGEEGGHALASVLFGDINPSGKLPTTFGAERSDYPDYGHFPGVNGTVDYAEGIYVGYRYFDKQHIAPLFPFGYGLSYTTFRYANLRLDSPSLDPTGIATVKVDITNTGKRAGAEVAELYVGDDVPLEDRPIRELKGFEKVFLKPGQTKTVTIKLTPRDLAYCDVAGKQWKADAGVYTLAVGASSRDIRQTIPLRLTADYTKPIPNLGAQPNLDPNDLALGKPVTVSSTQDRPDVAAPNAVDGDDGTRWGSEFSDPQWIAIDLGKPQTIAHVRLIWEDAFASAYQIQVSDNGVNWTDVYSTTDGQGGQGDDKFAPVTARWVRIYCTKRGTNFGDSLYSVEVYGVGK